MTLSQPVESVSLAGSSAPARKLEATRILESFDRLFELLEGVSLADPEGRTVALRALVRFFRASAAGLYVALQPGHPMELQAEYRFSDQVPQSLGAPMITSSGRDARTIVELRIVGAGSGVWSRAAEAAAPASGAGCAAALELAGGPADAGAGRGRGLIASPVMDA